MPHSVASPGFPDSPQAHPSVSFPGWEAQFKSAQTHV